MFSKIAGSVRWESKLTGKSAMITLRHAGVATGRDKDCWAGPVMTQATGGVIFRAV